MQRLAEWLLKKSDTRQKEISCGRKMLWRMRWACGKKDAAGGYRELSKNFLRSEFVFCEKAGLWMAIGWMLEGKCEEF